MTTEEKIPSERLSEIFSKINMSELPAMSSNVMELLSLAGDGVSGANELAEIILKDYSLTNKVLQVVNSAFYSLSRPVTTISRAITMLGYDAIRDLATPIALFEDFVKSGVEKEGISKILAASFLSGLQARDLVIRKNLKMNSEEAFICSLLRDLGKIIVCIYLPGSYREIESLVDKGEDENEATSKVLDELTFSEIGMEVAKFWNLSAKVIAAMEVDPPKPQSTYDEDAMLTSLADFTNRLVDAVTKENDISPLMSKYARLFSLEYDELVGLMNWSIEAAENISAPMRFGLTKLKIKSKVLILELSIKNRARIKRQPAGDDAVEGETGESKEKSVSGIDAFVDKLMHEMSETLTGSFNINDVYKKILEGLCKGVGYERAILSFVKARSTKVSLVGRMGFGDIDSQGVVGFEHALYSSFMLANPSLVIPRSLKACKDMAIPVNTPNVFPEELDVYVRDRNVYLFPICIDKKPIGLFYLDRKAESPRLDENQLKATRVLRDLAVMAIIRKRDQEE
ncbi:MAG: HDOD domain-containing protein [Proteobacteria bacterium]|nr:HDOD domain-containing protein [Pseudomonadota bacterium]MBU1711039.1 HDOD domain-containing protein [Pseudomonadota bacterium]